MKRFDKILTRYLSRKVGFEAVLRIRCSHGLAITAFYGNFFVRSTDLLALANVNPDSSLACQVKGLFTFTNRQVEHFNLVIRVLNCLLKFLYSVGF